MGKFFHRLARDCKGAVTVFVTLLLIPAVLVSGTGVDLARLYTARSILHDANQLAANSVLASYDALLQDLYGLYGVMKDDPEFAAMVDEYIQVAVFGEDWVDREAGTFQLFYGSELIPGDVTPAEGKNLANQEVLRRQIEEYAKFRAPAIIVSEILDKLDSFEKVQEDAAVIKDKMEIEDRIEEIDRLYKRIYKSIQYLNGIKDYESVMPLCNSDNLLTTLIYRLGWLPFLLLMLIIAGLAGCLLVRCLRQRSQMGQFLVVTVVVMLSVPALLSVAWNLGFTWNGGLFPLLMGNVTTVLYMGLIGLALSAFRGDNIVRDQVCNTGYHPRYRIKISIQKL